MKNRSSIAFDPLPAAASLLDPTLSAVVLRDDMAELLTAAKTYIKAKVICVILYAGDILHLHNGWNYTKTLA